MRCAAAWQVMEVYQLCVQHNFVRPSVYQGMYNACTRAVEPELFPCLRQLGLAFYAYNPLMGGLLTGRYTFERKPQEDGRFANNKSAEMYALSTALPCAQTCGPCSPAGPALWRSCLTSSPLFCTVRYLARYWKQSLFDAIDRIRAALHYAHGDSVSLTDASLRWMVHHSQLKGEHGDAVILGASKIEHVTGNLKGIAGGPLEPAVVKAFDEAWEASKADCIVYYR